MLGNVAEWVLDRYDKKYYESMGKVNNDPLGPPIGDKRVLRGGSAHDPQERVRASARAESQESSNDFYIGFRCAGEFH